MRKNTIESNSYSEEVSSWSKNTPPDLSSFSLNIENILDPSRERWCIYLSNFIYRIIQMQDTQEKYKISFLGKKKRRGRRKDRKVKKDRKLREPPEPRAPAIALKEISAYRPPPVACLCRPLYSLHCRRQVRPVCFASYYPMACSPRYIYT